MHTLLFFIRHTQTTEDNPKEIEIAYDKVKRHLNRKRSIVLPKSPTTCAELRDAYLNEIIMNLYGYTKSSNKKIFFKYSYESTQFSYCIYVSEKVITLMTIHLEVKDRNFLIDAKFKVCPFGESKQLLIIYIEYMGRVIFRITFIYINMIFLISI